MSNQTSINRTPLTPSDKESRLTSSLQQSPPFIGCTSNTVDRPLPLPPYIGYTSTIRTNHRFEGSKHILDHHAHAIDFGKLIFGQENLEKPDEPTLCDFLLFVVTKGTYLGTREQPSEKPDTPPRKQLYFSVPMRTEIVVICPNPNKTDDPEDPDPRPIRRLKTAYVIDKFEFNRFVQKNYVYDESRNRNTP